MKAIDFFCGAGGLTRGLLDAGIEVLAGVDNEERLRQTYEHNNQPSQFICEDIGQIDIQGLRANLEITQDDTVLYAACTPCQPFSTLNTLRGEDERKFLLLAFARLVMESPPDFIIVENVPGLNNAYGRAVYERFIEMLEEAGFNQQHLDSRLLDAHDYGVPQVRKRFIMVASRHGEIALPEPNLDEQLTVADILMNYPPLESGESSDAYHNHKCRRLQSNHLRIAQAVPINGGSRSDVKDTTILLDCHQRNPKAHKDVFGRMAWDKPSPTLTCRCTDIYCGRFTHPDQDRGISLREAAALQSFSDDYQFFGSFAHIARQIGNAVPVRLAEQLGSSVITAANTIEVEG